jgi:hypothetical protein
MNSLWKTNQEKYVLKQISSLLREIRLLIICYIINPLLLVERRYPPPLLLRENKIKNWKFSYLLRKMFSYSKVISFFEIYLTSYSNVYENRFYEKRKFWIISQELVSFLFLGNLSDTSASYSLLGKNWEFTKSYS